MSNLVNENASGQVRIDHRRVLASLAVREDSPINIKNGITSGSYKATHTSTLPMIFTLTRPDATIIILDLKHINFLTNCDPNSKGTLALQKFDFGAITCVIRKIP